MAPSRTTVDQVGNARLVVLGRAERDELLLRIVGELQDNVPELDLTERRVVPIPGTKRPERVAENIAAAELTLTRTELEQLEAVAGRSAWVDDRQAFGTNPVRRPA